MCRNLEVRAAVNLNNTGIALVRRGNFRQGMKTLNDAVTVMKQAFHPGASAENPNNDDAFRFDTALSRAAQCVAQPEAEGVCSGLNIGIQTDDSSSYDHVADHHQYDVCMMHITEELATWNYDLPTITSATSSAANDLMSAITILNFGLSYRCMESTTTDDESKYSLLIGASRLLRLAHNILSNLLESDYDLDTGQMDHTEMRIVITTTLLVLKNLVQISTLLGDGESRHEYSIRFDHLCELARHYFQQAEGPCVVAASAA